MFRQNVGLGWVGSEVIHLKNGDLLIKNPRPLKAGLGKGSPDLVGWNSQGLFSGVEIKRKDRRSADQIRWDRWIKFGGGVSGVAHNVEEALQILRSSLNK